MSNIFKGWWLTILREYFAGQALAGLLAGKEHHFQKGTPSAEIAAAAYDLAAAMIAERELD